jgi:hypothetical protein
MIYRAFLFRVLRAPDTFAEWCPEVMPNSANGGAETTVIRVEYALRRVP